MATQCQYVSPHDGWRCPEAATTMSGSCIFHDPDLDKDVNALKARFDARLTDGKEDPLRFDGAIFPGGISFERVVFKRSISFYKAEFHGQRTSFEGAKFHGQETSFDVAKFHGQETSFEGAEFHGQMTSFWRTEFHGQETSFDVAKFHGQETSFLGAEFHGQMTSFAGARFYGQAIFRGWRRKQSSLEAKSTSKR